MTDIVERLRTRNGRADGFGLGPVCDEAADEIERLRAALAAPPVAPGWQPIETAPKDGRLFLCWVSAVRWSSPDGNDSSHGHDVSQVDFCSWRDGPRDLPGHGYFDPCCGQIGDGQDVTHWMPIPAAPGAPDAQQEPMSNLHEPPK